MIYFAAEVELSSTFRYGAAIAAFALLIAYYTGEYSGQCKLHEFFASINLIICVALSVVSILPKVCIAVRCLTLNISSSICINWNPALSRCKSTCPSLACCSPPWCPSTSSISPGPPSPTRPRMSASLLDSFRGKLLVNAGDHFHGKSP